MAILSEFEEDIHGKPTTSAVPPEKPFTAAFEPSNPLGFLEKVFEFVAKESDLFKSDSLVSDVNAVVKMVRDKVEAEGRKRKEVKSEVNGGKIEKKVKDVEKEEEAIGSKVEEGKGPREIFDNLQRFLSKNRSEWVNELDFANWSTSMFEKAKS